MIDSWFPTLIYRSDLPEFAVNNDHYKSKAYDLKSKYNHVVTDWRCDTFNTLDNYYYLDDRDSKIIDLVEICKTHVLKFSKVYGVDIENHELTCKDFWFNIAAPGAYQEYHQHENNHFSLVYYVSAKEKSGNIIFRSIESLADGHSLPIKRNHFTLSSAKTCYYTPAEASILIFRSNLLHMVEKNFSDDDRISIAMNFNFERI